MSEKHAGSVIEKTIRRHHLSITTISRKMNIHRRTLYNWFNKKELPYTVIIELGKVLDHDFSEDLALEDITTYKENLIIQKPKKSTIDKYQYWMFKYLELLNKYSELKKKSAQNPRSSDLN